MHGGTNSGRGPRACWTCGKTDHINRDCPNKKCFNCGGRGHVSMNCRRGGGGSHQQGGSSASAMTAVTASASQVGNGGRGTAGVYSHFDDEDGDVAWMATESDAKAIGADEWVLDSGATRHLTNNKELLTNIRALTPPIELRVADNKVLWLRECGTASLTLLNGKTIPLHGVAFHQELAVNLLSIGRIAAAGYEILFGQNEAMVRNRRGEVVLRAQKKETLYVVHQVSKTPISGNRVATSSTDAVYHAQSVVSTGSPVPTSSVSPRFMTGIVVSVTSV